MFCRDSACFDARAEASVLARFNSLVGNRRRPRGPEALKAACVEKDPCDFCSLWGRAFAG